MPSVFAGNGLGVVAHDEGLGVGAFAGLRAVIERAGGVALLLLWRWSFAWACSYERI